MNPIRFGLYSTAIFVALSAAALSAAPPATGSAAAAPAAAHDHDHAAAGIAAKPEVAATSDMMKQMQAMHAKVMAAKTPTERAALMPAHMAMMQNGMAMMQKMQKPTGGDATSQRMEMMQMMMQMMMDRMPMSMPDGQKPDSAK
jgi:hypothetical protein